MRKILKIPLLKSDPRLAMLKQGVLRAAPHNPSGALPLAVVMALSIANTWGRSRVWWKVMIALLTLIMFLSLLRGAGALSIPIGGVTWVIGTDETPVCPASSSGVSGVLLLVPVRKTKQTAPSWIPLKAGRVTEMLLRFCDWRQRNAQSNEFLFPSRRKVSVNNRRQWHPHQHNGLSYSSFMRLLRLALTQVCGLSQEQALRFTLHSLRVGGINYYKRIGVSIGLRAQIAEHKSLRTSRRYLRLLPFEQLDELSHMIEPR